MNTDKHRLKQPSHSAEPIDYQQIDNGETLLDPPRSVCPEDSPRQSTQEESPSFSIVDVEEIEDDEETGNTIATHHGDFLLTEDEGATIPQFAKFLVADLIAAAPSSTEPPRVASRSGDARIGQIFGKYRLIRRLGKGGMGEVYAARHCDIGTQAAVKLLSVKHSRNWELCERFLNEAKAVNIIRHEGLVKIFDHGQQADGTLYIVMELLEGESLAQRLEREDGPVSVAEAVEIAWHVAHALKAAHAKHIIHRDLKPANVMLSAVSTGDAALEPYPSWSWSCVKVVDFGVAKLSSDRMDLGAIDNITARGELLGSPHYMAPEQFSNAEKATDKADVFSLGVVLYEMLTGRRPACLSSERPLEQPFKSTGHLSAFNIPRLSALLHRMLRTNPKYRPSMRAVVQQLGRIRAAMGRAPANRRRLIWPWAAAGAIAGAAACLAIWLRVETISVERAKAHALAAAQAGIGSADPALQKLGILALGQSGDLSHSRQLEPLLKESAPEVVEAAAQAIGQIRDVMAAGTLTDLAETSGGLLSIKLLVSEALLQLRNSRGQEILQDMLKRTAAEQQGAARILLEHGNLVGVPVLYQMIDRGLLSEQLRWQLLYQLAMAGESEAKRRLEARFKETVSLQQAVSVGALFGAYYRARIGDEVARHFLTASLEQAGRFRLLAAQLGAAIGEPKACAILSRIAPDSADSESNRVIALQGLADCAAKDALPVLDRLVTGSNRTISLTAAASVYHIVAANPGEVERNVKFWAQQALNGSNPDDQLEAIAVMAGSRDPESILILGAAVEGKGKIVRKEVINALGQKPTKGALKELRRAFHDPDVEVREAGMRAIHRVFKALGIQEGQTLDRTDLPVMQGLRKLASSDNQQDRTVASGILLRLGDHQYASQLREALRFQNPLVRRLAVEFADVEGEVLQRALDDSDEKVRWAAARRMAENGSLAGESVLRKILASGDLDGLYAYRLLKKLAQSAVPPPGLLTMLTSTPRHIRRQVVEALTDVPAEQALPLLIVASRDDATEVRWQVVTVAHQLCLVHRSRSFLNVLRSLSSDPSPWIRSKVAEALKQLPDAQELVPSRGASGELPSTPPLQELPPNPPPKETVRSGALFVSGEELVRFKVDSGLWLVLPKPAVQIPAGKHKICWETSCQVVEIIADQTKTLTLPIIYSEQLLQQVGQALQSANLPLAEDRLARLEQMRTKGTLKGELIPKVIFFQGKLAAAKGDNNLALSHFNAVLDFLEGQPSSVLNHQAEEAARRVPKVCVLERHLLDESSRCHHSFRFYPEGRIRYQVIGRGHREINVHPGVSNVVDHCQ